MEVGKQLTEKGGGEEEQREIERERVEVCTSNKLGGFSPKEKRWKF